MKHIILFFRYADQVSIGYEVLVEENDQLTSAGVIDVVTITVQGNYIYIIWSFLGFASCHLSIGYASTGSSTSLYNRINDNDKIILFIFQVHMPHSQQKVIL